MNDFFAANLAGRKDVPRHLTQDQRHSQQQEQCKKRDKHNGMRQFFGNGYFNNRNQQRYQNIGRNQAENNNGNQFENGGNHILAVRSASRFLGFNVIFAARRRQTAFQRIVGTALVLFARQTDIFHRFNVGIILHVKVFLKNFDGNFFGFAFFGYTHGIITLVAGKTIFKFPAVAPVRINFVMRYFDH